MVMRLEQKLVTQQDIQKYISNQQMHFNIYDVYYLRYFHQRVSAGIMVFFKVILLLQECCCG
jgi:hypothetical protein